MVVIHVALQIFTGSLHQQPNLPRWHHRQHCRRWRIIAFGLHPNGRDGAVGWCAVTAFWTAANIAGLTRGGFGNLGLVRQQWTNIYVAPPITYFVPVPGTANPFRTYRLTGLGVGFPPVLGCS